MFVLSALVYPVLLAVLCTGAGLLVDRASGGFLSWPLLPAVGAAALIAISQWTTYLVPLAPATPYLLAAAAAGGFAISWPRAVGLARRWRAHCWQLLVPVLAYVLALAPVLLAGRPTFSSYMALADSAVHMIGADFLLHHGQHYAHLDLGNSYGQFINAYYNSSYPSGADTLFGASAFLLGLPLIWAFQPLNAFMLATATGPAWLLARRLGLSAAWAAPAALTASLPALVYGYELLGSIKEITALAMILSLGALLAAHPRWLRGAPTGAIPFALVLAAGVSALGAGFGAWALAPAAIVLIVLIGDVRSARQRRRHALLVLAAGALTALVAAWPTWVDLAGSLHVAQTIATTSNPGNLHAPLRFIQVFGVWLRGSYKLSPTGAVEQLTYVLVGLTAVAAVLGAVHLIRRRDHALAAWFALMLVVYFALSRYSTAWASAKGLMLTSPAVVLLAWGGVAALRGPAAWPRLAYAAPVLALAIAAGVLASDLAQYHSSNLAPTARYQELAAINKRYAGRGPTLFTDFDEWALYQLRDLDVGGPNFVYPPPALRTLARGYGYPVDLDRASPAALRAYPLIITRRNPTTSPPPAAYGLLWHGAYYQVWARLPGAPAAIAHYGAAPASALSCTRVQGLARLARSRAANLLAAASPELVRVSLASARRPASWGHQRNGLVMRDAGRLTAGFTVPASGEWNLWLQGQIMPAVTVRVDGRPLASPADELDGNSLIPDTAPPVRVRLSAGSHQVSVTRGGFTLAPGDGGSAVLDGIFLTPARGGVREVRSLPPGGGRSLCARSYYWIDVVPAHAVA